MMKMVVQSVDLVNFPDDCRFPGKGRNRLLAWVKVVINNSWVVKDIRIVRGSQRILVAMPSTYVQDYCPFCNRQNRVEANYCNWCGCQLDSQRAYCGEGVTLVKDLFHPLNNETRMAFEELVLNAYYRRVDELQPREKVS